MFLIETRTCAQQTNRFLRAVGQRVIQTQRPAGRHQIIVCLHQRTMQWTEITHETVACHHPHAKRRIQRRFEGGQSHFAVALGEMGIADVQAGTFSEYRQIQACAFNQKIDVDIASEIPRRHGAQMLTGVRGNADDSKKRSQREHDIAVGGIRQPQGSSGTKRFNSVRPATPHHALQPPLVFHCTGENANGPSPTRQPSHQNAFSITIGDDSIRHAGLQGQNIDRQPITRMDVFHGNGPCDDMRPSPLRMLDPSSDINRIGEHILVTHSLRMEESQRITALILQKTLMAHRVDTQDIIRFHSRHRPVPRQRQRAPTHGIWRACDMHDRHHSLLQNDPFTVEDIRPLTCPPLPRPRGDAVPWRIARLRNLPSGCNRKSDDDLQSTILSDPWFHGSSIELTEWNR